MMFDSRRVELNVGLEGYRDSYNWKTFENFLDPNNPGSTQGPLLSDNSERRAFVNAFAQSIFHIGQLTNLETGLNLNSTSYTFRTLSGEGVKRFDPVISPRISFVQVVTEEINAFATVSHGFSPPSIDETMDESGDFNRDIRPETGWNRELGIKGNFQKVNFAASIYSMDIKNLLVTRRTAEDVTFGKNAGSTRHNGLELTSEFLLYQRGLNQLRMTGSYSRNNFIFQKFNDDGADYSGNQLTGVPKQQWNVTLFQDSKWVFSGLNFLAVGAMPITDDNSVFSSSYHLLNAFAGVRFPTGKKLKTELTYRMNNVFNEKYASMLNINAQAFGSAEPRYYYPGMPRNHQVSLVIGY
jgi:iron complex outermembrane receptor protein